jgi:hypothetical protein
VKVDGCPALEKDIPEAPVATIETLVKALKKAA